MGENSGFEYPASVFSPVFVFMKNIDEICAFSPTFTIYHHIHTHPLTLSHTHTLTPTRPLSSHFTDRRRATRAADGRHARAGSHGHLAGGWKGGIVFCGDSRALCIFPWPIRIGEAAFSRGDSARTPDSGLFKFWILTLILTLIPISRLWDYLYSFRSQENAALVARGGAVRSMLRTIDQVRGE